MAIKKLSTKTFLTFVTICAAGYCASPLLAAAAAGALLDVTKDDLKKIFGNFLGHGSHELAVKYFEYEEKTANNEKNHDLRKWLVIAVVELLEREVERLNAEKKHWGAQLLIERMSTIAERLDAVMPDERYQAVTEAALTDFLVPQHVDFATARALKPELWLEILGGVVADVEGTQDPTAKAQKLEALESAAKALHEKLPLELVVKYREAFTENPEIYVAVQTSLSQLMMEELRATGTDVKRLAALSAEYQEKFAQFTQANLTAMQRLAIKQDDVGHDFRAFVDRYEKDFGIQNNLLSAILKGNREVLATLLAARAEDKQEHAEILQAVHAGNIETRTIIVDEIRKGYGANQSANPPTSKLPPKELSIKTITYLSLLSEATTSIELRGIKNLQHPLKLPVKNAYVPLRGRLSAENDANNASDKKPGADHPGEAREIDVALNEVLAKFGPRVAIVGGAGSGKSTVLQYMVWVLATAYTTDVNGKPDIATPKDLLGLDVTPDNMPVPLFAPLSSLQTATDREELVAQLNAYLQKAWGVPEGYVTSLLDSGRALVLLLDGLDEVALDNTRGVLGKAIEDLAKLHSSNLRVAVTCRTAAYAGEQTSLSGFNVVNVQPLDAEDVKRLVTAAGEAMRAQGRRDGADIASALQADITALEQQRKAQLGDRYTPLVDSPLIVRLMLIVKSGEPDRPLPAARAELYDRVVEAALRHSYGLDGRPAQDAENRWDTRRKLMQYVAFGMQASESGENSGTVAFTQSELENAIPDGAAGPEDIKDLLGLARQRATLLDVRDNQFHFIHRTFQEFLAARHLCEVVSGRGKIKDRVAAVLAVVTPVVEKSWWRECILLTAGYWACRDEALAREFVRALAKVGDTPDACFAAADLAGNAALEWADSDKPTRELCANRVASLLAEKDNLLNSEQRTRHGAALAMSRLGDPRFHGPEFFCLHKGDMLGLVKIDADGGFMIGTRSERANDVHSIVGGERAWIEPEINDMVTPTNEFYMSRFPVTVAQFRVYAETSGVSNSRYGVFANEPSQPVSAHWHVAQTYCAWLNFALAQDEKKYFKNNELLNFWQKGWRFSLPSELEWEKAARGGSAGIYPWGDDVARLPAMANVNIGSTTVVGCYTANAYGLHDMIGNMWEWTSSRRQPYPPHRGYEAHELPRAKDEMIVRGGSWLYAKIIARCASRTEQNPNLNGHFAGFRVVLRPFR